MVPKIAAGHDDFHAAGQYHLHDKKARTCERVAWTLNLNMTTTDPAKAFMVMAHTAKAQGRLKEASGQSRAGRKLQKPVFSFSLAWHPEQSPSREHVQETALKAIEALGLQEHEAVLIAHKDEPQTHVHIVINRVHPVTGLAGDVRNSKRKTSDFARNYQRAHGEDYCPQREENHKKRQMGQNTFYSDRNIVQAWETTNTGHAFAAALQQHGCTLARGHKRIVIVDPYGKTHNPTRLLKDVKAKDIRARLSDLDLSKLPRADDVATKAKSVDHDVEDQRAAFEAAAEKQMQTLREKHAREHDTLDLKQTRRLDHTKKQLSEYYSLAKRKSAISALKEKIRSASWLQRLLGTTRKDRKTYQEQAKTYNKAVHLYREKLSGITAQSAKDVENLKSRQDDERRKLEFQIDMKRSTGDYAMTRGEQGKERAASQLARDFSKTQEPGLEKNLKNLSVEPDKATRHIVSPSNGRTL